MKRLLQTAIFVFLYFSNIFLVAQPYPEWEQYISPNPGIWECKLKNNILYCGTNGAGLVEYNLETKETISYTVYNKGLASNEISDVDVDNDGNIWLGYWGKGISKIHTEGCKIFNKANSGLQNDTVNTICVDHNNKIWIGTQQGIDVIDGEDWIHYDKSNSGMTNNLICTIEVDAENNKWIGSVNSFFIFDDLEWNVYSVNWQQECYFEEIAVVDSETAYFDVSLFGSGLFMFHDGILENLYWPGPLYKYITDLDFDGDGNLWISAWNANSFGIAMYNGSEFTEYSLGNIGNDCFTLNVDQDNNIWLGIEYKGLYKYGNTFMDKVSDGLFGCEYVEAISIKNDSSVWFGNYDKFIEYSSGEWKNSNDFVYGFNAEDIRDIDINSQGDMWVAGGSEAILFNDNDWFVYNEMNSPLTNTWPDIHDILVDANDILWVAENGLLKFDGEWSSYNTGNSGIPFENILSLAMDSSGVLWMGGLEGLASFDGQTFHHFDTISGNIYFDRIHSICVDSVNTKWIGSENGLIVYDNENWWLFDTINSDIPANYVIAIQIDKTGNLWAGTENGIGILKENIWTVYNTNNSSLSSNFIFNIEVSQNNTVWITTSYGIAKYNKNGFVSVSNRFLPSQAGLCISSYPNPFSDITNIQFCLSNKIAGMLNVYNMTGKKLKTIKAGSFLSGENSYSWDGTDDQGELVKGGIYFCQFLSEKYSGTVKLIRY